MGRVHAFSVLRKIHPCCTGKRPLRPRSGPYLAPSDCLSSSRLLATRGPSSSVSTSDLPPRTPLEPPSASEQVLSADVHFRSELSRMSANHGCGLHAKVPQSALIVPVRRHGEIGEDSGDDQAGHGKALSHTSTQPHGNLLPVQSRKRRSQLATTVVTPNWQNCARNDEPDECGGRI